MKYCFLGSLSNEAVHHAYQEKQFDCFVSVSESEGLPVSMMEAMSYGIPVVATNVGGVSELVSEDNGILLPANPTPQEIADELKKFYFTPIEEKKRCRLCAKETWSKNFDADANADIFVSKLIEL